MSSYALLAIVLTNPNSNIWCFSWESAQTVTPALGNDDTNFCFFIPFCFQRASIGQTDRWTCKSHYV